MRIAHVTDTMQIGGAETIICSLARAQRAAGHHVTTHCLYDIGPLGEQLRTEGFDVLLHGPGSTGRLMRALLQSFRSRQPDVVHCHNATATIAASVPARLAGVRRVISTRHGLVAPPYNILRELKFGVASRACDYIVAVCDAAGRNLAAAPLSCRRKIVRVYNGTDELVTASIRERSGHFTFVHVARLSAPKDQSTLLRAFAIAQRRQQDLRLWMVGDGPLRTELEALAKQLGIDSTAQFVGEQTNVGHFYAAAQAFVMSSVSEGLPMSLLEAMSAGLPVIVTNVGGMAEVAELAGGTVVPAGNPEVLAEAMLRLSHDQQSAMRAGECGRSCYRKYFTASRMAAEYSTLYTAECCSSLAADINATDAIQ